MEELNLDVLNDAQTDVIHHKYGPLLVIAGAGSGKTSTIVYRIAKLLESGVAPEKILGLTFSNHAVEEMRERVNQIVGSSLSKRISICTFHSFGVRFLGEEGKTLGLKGPFVIFDQADSYRLARDILKKEFPLQRRFDVHAIMGRISKWKNSLVSFSNSLTFSDEYDRVARDIFDHYQTRLQMMHAFDFDDLVVKPMMLLRESEVLRSKWQRYFDFILIDEFQDTNISQFELVRLLLNQHCNLCVVGDDDQAIYAWRGANVKNIFNFKRCFPTADIIKLEINYRSRPHILEVANHLIEQNKERPYAKQLCSVRCPGFKVRRITLGDSEQEARFTVDEIRHLMQSNHPDIGSSQLKYSDIAVLYRSNQQSKVLEEHLSMASIPYRVLGGIRFYDRKEIKDILAYLRLIENPFDDLSLRRILNTPPRGIGPKSLSALEAYCIMHGKSLYESLECIDDFNFASWVKQKVHRFVHILNEARQSLGMQVSLREIISNLVEEVGLIDYFASHSSDIQRKDHVDFFLGIVSRYEASHISPTLLDLLNRFSLSLEKSREKNAGNVVTLSSLHSAKGLEFAVVFIIGCIEGHLPHSRVLNPKINEIGIGTIEDERKLFYVGITRACDLLYLSSTEIGMIRGKRIKQTPSRFLQELPSSSMEIYTPRPKQTLQTNELVDLSAKLMEQLQST